MDKDFHNILEQFCSTDVSPEKCREWYAQREHSSEDMHEMFETQTLCWLLNSHFRKHEDKQKNALIRQRVMDTINMQSEQRIAIRTLETLNALAEKEAAYKEVQTLKNLPACKPVRQKPKQEKKVVAFPAMFAAIGMAAALLIGIFFLTNASPTTPEHTVTVIAANSGNYHGTQAIRTGDTITFTETLAQHTPTASLTLRLEDGSIVKLNNGGRMEYGKTQEGGHLFRLLEGSFFATVSPQSKPFSVNTQHASMQVLGTVFAVDLNKDQTRVSVTEGKVQVTSANNQSILTKDTAVIVDHLGDIAWIANNKPTEALINANTMDAFWPVGTWVEAEGGSPFSHYIKSGDRVEHGLRYRIVSHEQFEPDSLFYFAKNQTIRITVRAHQTGRMRLEMPGDYQYNIRPYFYFDITADEVGQWVDKTFFIEKAKNASMKRLNGHGCRRIILDSNHIKDFDLAEIKVSTH